MTEQSVTYRQAGVDIEKGEEFSQWIRKKRLKFARVAGSLIPFLDSFRKREA